MPSIEFARGNNGACTHMISWWFTIINLGNPWNQMDISCIDKPCSINLQTIWIGNDDIRFLSCYFYKAIKYTGFVWIHLI